MQPYMNPANDFYMRNAQQMYQQPPYQQQFNFPPPQPRLPPINATWVTSIEEAKAAHTDDFLATNLFLDTSSGKLYMKRMDNDGKAQFLTYVIEEPVVVPDPINEINKRLMKLEDFIGGLHDKSISSNAGTQQSAAVPVSAITEQNANYDEAKSTGFSKDAGNDKWKKRN